MPRGALVQGFSTPVGSEDRRGRLVRHVAATVTGPSLRASATSVGTPGCRLWDHAACRAGGLDHLALRIPPDPQDGTWPRPLSGPGGQPVGWRKAYWSVEVYQNSVALSSRMRMMCASRAATLWPFTLDDAITSAIAEAIVDEDRLQVELERALGDFQQLAQESVDGVPPVVVVGELAAPGLVPDQVLGEDVVEDAEVAGDEGGVCVPDASGIRMLGHHDLLLARDRRQRGRRVRDMCLTVEDLIVSGDRAVVRVNRPFC